MNGWIELTEFDNAHILVRTDAIQYVEEGKLSKSAYIAFDSCDEACVKVKESYDEVAERILMAERSVKREDDAR